MEFRKLSDSFGVEVIGADLASLPEDGFQELKDTFYRHQVLVARSQQLSPSQFLEFARRIGPPEPHVIDQFHHPEHADILILSNVEKDGRPTGLADEAGLLADPARACQRMKQLLAVHGIS